MSETGTETVLNPRTDAEQQCRDCEQWLPFDQFYRHPSGGLRGTCKACWKVKTLAYQRANSDAHRARAKAWRERTYTSRRDRTLRTRFGMTQADFDQVLAAQGGVCAICRGRSTDTTFHIDHDHATGKFRGVLCGLCNRMLGQAQDDILRLRAAITYLGGTA